MLYSTPSRMSATQRRTCLRALLLLLFASLAFGAFWVFSEGSSPPCSSVVVVKNDHVHDKVEQPPTPPAECPPQPGQPSECPTPLRWAKRPAPTFGLKLETSKLPASLLKAHNNNPHPTILYDSLGLAICVPPKVSCTRWRQLYMRVRGDPDWRQRGEMHHAFLTGKRELINPERLWYRAAFFRHPVTRVISAHGDKVAGQTSYSEKLWLFDAFVDYLYASRDVTHHFNEHWRPFADLCHVDPAEPDPFTYIGQLENGAHDTKALLSQLRIGDTETDVWSVYGTSGWCEAYQQPGMCPEATRGHSMYDLPAKHATHADHHRNITRSSFDKLLEIYHVDFDMWGARLGWETDYDRYVAGDP